MARPWSRACRSCRTTWPGRRSPGSLELPGRIAFKLYDTFGFPLELTQEILEERGLSVDMAGFQAAMEEQRERARASRPEDAARRVAGFGVWDAYRELETGFQGYNNNNLSFSAHVMAIVRDDADVDEAPVDAKVQVLLDTTPFYPEGGGQVGDRGLIKGPSGVVEVEDTKKIGKLIIHQGYVRQGALRKGDLVLAEVDSERRQASRPQSYGHPPAAPGPAHRPGRARASDRFLRGAGPAAV